MDPGRMPWAKAYALIRYYYRKDPERLSEAEILKLVGELPFIREHEVQIIEEALARVVSKMFGETS